METPRTILGPTGRIAARLSHYEHRPQQLEMADAVHRALRDGHHLVVEAGTGVGKSFGYLVPAILVATEDRPETTPQRPRTILIATHTVSLQEQLLAKDIPFLNSVIPLEFTAVLAKGRGHYLSRRRLDMAVKRSQSLFHQPVELDQLQRLKQWASLSGDGSRSDLSFEPYGGVWDEVASDSGNCMGRNCPTHKTCFYYAARRRLQNAQLVIANHALFFADLALRMSNVNILPDYDAVIFDEAHMLESVASEHFGISASSGQVDYTLNKLFNDHTNKGLLVTQAFGSNALIGMQKEVLACRTAADHFFSEIHEWRMSQREGNGRVLQPELFENTLSPTLKSLAVRLRTHSKQIENETERQDFVAAADRLNGLAGQVSSWVDQLVPESVYWADSNITRRGNPVVNVSAAPVDIAPLLREHLFGKTRSVILTSATLAVGKRASFDFFKSRIGLTQSESLQLGSPFNYREQAKLILVEGMPDPTQQKERYDQACSAMIRRYVAKTDGHAFVLFTSYDMVRRVARDLTPWLARRNLALYSQADGGQRSQLLERFKANPRGVLLGVASFWQGVDVPGDALQNVIITRLPFSVPDHPLLQAKLEAIRESGGNPFMDYQLPEAIIKFKQGFGRLIRTSQDRGMVVLLDPRVTTKFYGRQFLESLPACQILREPFTDEPDDDVTE